MANSLEAGRQYYLRSIGASEEEIKNGIDWFEHQARKERATLQARSGYKTVGSFMDNLTDIYADNPAPQTIVDFRKMRSRQYPKR